MKKLLLVLIALALQSTFIFCQNVQKDFPVLKGPYLGQKPPGMTPELFAPGIVSTGLNERDITFTPDRKELYFTARFNGSSAIVTCKIVNGKWTAPEVAKFSSKYPDFEPFISCDGSIFYFCSNRPLDNNSDPIKGSNIWVMKKEGNKWGKPIPLGEPINGKGNVYFPTVTKSGTMYFTRREADEKEYIYRSKFVNGKFQEPEKLPKEVNTTDSQFNSYISPDESYLIIPVFGRKDAIGSTDYYVAFRGENDKWSDLINLGPSINSNLDEYSPSLSPDGKYFFFQRNNQPIKKYEIPVTYKQIQKIHNSPENGNSDIYWVDAKVIEKLRPKELK